MKRDELKDLILEAYIEVLAEQEALQTGTQEILGKFPTLKRSLVSLLTNQYEDFVKEIHWIVPKPTTFKVVLKNDQMFYMKWLGKGFEAQIGGKKYYLSTVDQFQQALDKLGELMKYAQPATTSPEESPEFSSEPEGGAELGGGLGGETPSLEEPPVEEPGEEAGVEFEEPGEEPGEEPEV